MGETTRIEGSVVDATSGDPIAGASIHVSRTDVTTVSAADGTFVLSEVPESGALVIAAKEGYEFASTTADGSVELELTQETEAPRGEYPRPDADRRPFTDDAWLSLNGTWSFAFDPDDIGEAEQWFSPEHDLDLAIRVPFPYQSLAAWGEEQLATNEVFQSAYADYRGAVWYQRSFTVPQTFPRGSDVRLRIGAADYGAAVWLDGEQVLPYSGDGYTEITADLGKLLPGSTHTLAIRVVAPPTVPETPYPQGKQTGTAPGKTNDDGWFSDIGGIWQSVWIEPYSDASLAQTHVTPVLTFEGESRTPSAASVTIDVAAQGVTAGSSVGVTLTDPDGQVITEDLQVELTDGLGSVVVPIASPKLWEPDSPDLYTADFTLSDGEGAQDGVRTFFGMRSIERDWAPGHEDEYQYIYLNNRPIYVRGVLDQGYNPWGIYTYTGVTAGPDLSTGTEADPGRGSILLDLKNAKDLGFNVVRHHLKVNEPAYYHWADKLGLLIWYDMPNAGWGSQGDPEAEQLYEELLRNTLQRDYNHPSIVIWTVFNESWGLTERPFHDPIPETAFGYVRRMVDLTRDLDSSRLVIDNSPCCQNGHLEGSTDLNDFHYYLASYSEWKNLLDGIAPQIHPGSTWNFNDGVQDGQPWLNSESAISSGQFPHHVSLFRSYPQMAGYVGVQIAQTEHEVGSTLFQYDRQPFAAEFLDHEGAPRTVAMFQRDDSISLMTRTALSVSPGAVIEVPVRVSHFSDLDLTEAQLRWRVGGYDGAGQWVAEADSGAQSIDPTRYTVTDLGSVSVTTPSELGVGYVWFWIEVGGETIAENYLTFDVPATTEGSSFSPSDVVDQDWSGGATAHGESDWVSGYGRGFFEYTVPVPEEIQTGASDTATLVLEVSSAQAPGIWDANHATGARRYPASLTVSVNGEALPVILLPDDPHGPLALAGRPRGNPAGDFGNRYGYRIAVPLDAVQLGEGATATLRLSSDGGGLSIFGVNSGRHGLAPTIMNGSVTVAEERPPGGAIDSRLSVYQTPASISASTGTGTVIVSVVNETSEPVSDIDVGLAVPQGWSATAVDPPTTDALSPGGGRHVAFTVASSQPVSTGDAVSFTATAVWNDQAIQAASTSTVAFDPEAYLNVGVDDGFDADSSDEYTVYKPSASQVLPDLTFGSGVLRAETDSASFGIVAHESGPVSAEAVVIVEHGSYAAEEVRPNSQYVGLVKDERNYVMAWTNILAGHGVDVMIDGQLTSTGNLGSGLLQPGDLWAFVLDGNDIAVWVDRGLGWQQMLTTTTRDRIDFTEPGALDGWRYGAGLRTGDVATIDSLVGRSGFTSVEAPDEVRPEVVLVSPSTAGPVSSVQIEVEATDDVALARIVANVYRDGSLVRSTQTRVDGATSATHTAEVSLPDGDYTIRYNAHDQSGNVSRTGSFDVTVGTPPPADSVRPEVVLVSPSTAGPVSSVQIEVEATDDVALARIVANVYRDGSLVRSTQTRVDGATSATHTAEVSLPDGDYTIRYNAHDQSGNVSRTGSFDVTVGGFDAPS